MICLKHSYIRPFVCGSTGFAYSPPLGFLQDEEG